MTEQEWLNNEELPVTIWKNKYQNGDESFEQWLDRVSRRNEFVKDLIREKKFIFGGRILANRGAKGRKTTLSNCFAAGSKVICKRGLVNIENITKGDEVLSSDGQMHRVNEIMEREYNGDLYRLHSHALYSPITCTPNHRFLTNHGWKRADRIFPSAIHGLKGGQDTLKTARFEGQSCFAHAGEGVEIDFTDGYKCEKGSRLFYTSEGKVGIENYANSSPIKERPTYIWRPFGHLVNRTATLTPDFMYFIGRWIGDGSITRRRAKRNHAILQIVFNATTEAEAAERCAAIGRQVFGIAPNVRRTNQNVIAVRFESPIIASWFFRHFGEKCDGKHIPQAWTGNLSILCGLLDADSCINTHGAVRIVLKNFNLLQWVKNSCYLNGINAGPIKDISERQPNAGELAISTTQAKAHLLKHLTKTYPDKRNGVNSEVSGDYIPITDVEVLENQTCKVYNLSVEGDHTYTINGVVVHNCYVLDAPTDTLESIFETGAKMARTFSYGGGCGLDVSSLRPKGAPVNNAAKSTSGVTSFMDFYSYITGLIGQEGRRGATMLSISCEHPDLEEFINLKSNLDVCTKANISVRVTDAFMQAVKTNSDFTLHFTMEDGSEIKKVVNARKIFMLLAQRNWEMAEPGILFWDRIESYNLLQNTGFKYAGVNPCAEEPLPAGGSCLLGSINLAQFVRNPFTKDARIDWDDLRYTTSVATIALNEVLVEGLPLHPLQEQRDSVRDWRQIGLGTLGLGDMLIKLGFKYGSEQSLKVIERVYRTIAIEAVLTSLGLAKEKDAFPKCTSDIKQAIITSDFIRNLNLPVHVIDDIQRNGLYNSQLLTCAPTGTIGTMLQVSTGVEPNFAFSYNRRTVSLNEEEKTYKVDAQIVKEYKSATSNAALPDYFVASSELNYRDRIAVQAVLQRYIDASISSTVNLPNQTTIEEVADLYMYAWESGLKGITIWRDGCQRQGILSTEKEEGKDKKVTTDGNAPEYNSIIPISRKKIGVTSGATFCKKCACGTLYITVNKDASGNLVEVFTHTSKGGVCAANTNGLTRMVSLAMRSGVSIREIKDQLKGINCPACLKLKAQGKPVDGISCPDILSKTIEEFEGMADFQTVPTIEPPAQVDAAPVEKADEGVCPECGATLEHQSGCRSCSNCGWSKCN